MQLSWLIIFSECSSWHDHSVDKHFFFTVAQKSSFLISPRCLHCYLVDFPSFNQHKLMLFMVGLQGLLTEGFFWIPSLAGPTTIAARTNGSGISWLFPFVVSYSVICQIEALVHWSPSYIFSWNTVLNLMLQGTSGRWLCPRSLSSLSWTLLWLLRDDMYGWTGWCPSFGVGWHNFVPSAASASRCFTIHLDADDATTSGILSSHVLSGLSCRLILY